MTGWLGRVYAGLLLASLVSVLFTTALMWVPSPADTAVIEHNLGGGVTLAVEALDRAADREAARAALAARFDMPIALEPARPLPRPVVFALDDAGRGFVSAASSSGEVVRFGPLPDYPLPVARMTVALIALALCWAVVALAVVRPQWRALRRMQAAARRMAGGDWGTRLGETVPAHARPMAAAFDRMADEIEAHIADRQRMMQVVSHELRTPLARLQFGIDLLAGAGSETERAGHAEGLYADIEQLDGLVDELQTFVRLDRPAPARRVPEAVGDILADVARREPVPDHVRLAVHAAEGPPLSADPTLVQRALCNLLRNALRYAAARVDVRAERVGDGWRIAIEDDGPGIPPGDRERVWRPFVRLTDDGAHDGSGLGLAIAQRIVRQHGGGVAIEDGSAGGARLITTWPDPPPSDTG